MSPQPDTYFDLVPGIAPRSYKYNDDNHPTIGGVDVFELIERFDTPLYVMDGETIRHQARQYKQTIEANYPGETLVLFAGKSNLNLGLCSLIDQEGLGIDVVSGGELYTVSKAKFPLERVLFNGNNKSLDEIRMALNHGVNRIIVDNQSELDNIHQVASELGVQANVLLRVSPGIECHTHEYLKTGNNDNKFGFNLAFLPQALEKITTTYQDTICLKGLHAHIGSQIFEVKAYEDLAEIMLNMYYNIRKEYDITLEDLDIGGGLGIHYTKADDPPPIETFAQRVTGKLVEYAKRLELPLPRLILEPGRSLTATAGVTLYTVGTRKEIPEGRTFVAVDGGMGDNIRPALYQAEYTAIVANKLSAPADESVRLVGKYCESGDILISEMTAPRMEAGDTVLVFGTGAYNATMASNYNRIPRPAMVLVEQGQAGLLIRRETYDDILSNDLVPPFLSQSSPQTVSTEA